MTQPSSRGWRTAARSGLIALTASLLSACVSPPPAAPELGDDPAPQSVVRLEGRMALTLEAHGGEDARAEQFNFAMQGHARRGELTLSTPLGTQLAAVRWRPGLAWTETGQGIDTYPDLDTLTRQLLGEPLPLAQLWSWMVGRPDADLPVTAMPSNGPAPAPFEQAGWLVTPATPDRPLIDISRPGTATQRGVRLKIRLD